MKVFGTSGTRLRRGVARRAGATVTLATCCAGAAIGAAGCGSSSVSNIVDPVAKAATLSSGASGYRMTMSLQLTSSALPTPITAAGTGAFRERGREGALTLNMSFGSNPATAQVLGSNTLVMTELLHGTTIFIKLPDALASKLPGGKPWLKVDLAKLGSSAGIPGLSSLMSPTTSNPGEMLNYLKAASGGVTKVGTERVGSVTTTHYRGMISLDNYPKLVPSSQRDAAKQAVAALERLTTLHSMPVDVWIDGHNLVRRIHVAFTESVQGQNVSAVEDITIPQYGAQPAPSFPSADQVTDLSSLLGSGA